MCLKSSVNMKNTYVVRVLDLPEHERVILKLIFSISEKSKLRSNAYRLASDLNESADLVIRDARGARALATDVVRELRVVDAAAAIIDAPVILRPLIATRVLAVLDDVFAATRVPQSVPAGPQNVASTPSAASAVVAFTATPAELDVNLETHGIPASQGAAVAAMVDAVLLSIPSDEPQVDLFSLPNEALDSTPVIDVPAAVKPRVLVVDDSPAVCKQLEIELRQFDVEVDYIPSARKAIEMLGKYSYQVAFLDVVLPDWDGFKICKHIKSKTPATIVVMLTDKATTGDKLRGALAGCNAYLVKPIARQMFQAAVKNHLPLATGSQALGA